MDRHVRRKSDVAAVHCSNQASQTKLNSHIVANTYHARRIRQAVLRIQSSAVWSSLARRKMEFELELDFASRDGLPHSAPLPPPPASRQPLRLRRAGN